MWAARCWNQISDPGIDGKFDWKKWCSRTESNRDLPFRKRPLYPFELREQLARIKIAVSQIAYKFVSQAILSVVSSAEQKIRLAKFKGGDDTVSRDYGSFEYFACQRGQSIEGWAWNQTKCRHPKYENHLF
jgi:hypothetical protein